VSRINDINNQIANKTAEEILRRISVLPAEKVTFSTSLSYEDQVITHMIFGKDLNIEVFTLDTGRVLAEK
jgi:phosphoadenosine phosphosulfate reductase